MDTQAITDSLNELSSELANINASIQELQQSLATAGIQAAVQPVMDEHDDTDLSDLSNALTETTSPIEEEALNEAGAPDVSSLLSDDPNKQLSADEIAALFAALG